MSCQGMLMRPSQQRIFAGSSRELRERKLRQRERQQRPDHRPREIGRAWLRNKLEKIARFEN